MIPNTHIVHRRRNLDVKKHMTKCSLRVLRFIKNNGHIKHLSINIIFINFNIYDIEINISIFIVYF